MNRGRRPNQGRGTTNKHEQGSVKHPHLCVTLIDIGTYIGTSTYNNNRNNILYNRNLLRNERGKILCSTR